MNSPASAMLAPLSCAQAETSRRRSCGQRGDRSPGKRRALDSAASPWSTWPVSDLFDVFRDHPFDIPRCRDAVDALVALPDSERVSDRAREFLASEPQDAV